MTLSIYFIEYILSIILHKLLENVLMRRMKQKDIDIFIFLFKIWPVNTLSLIYSRYNSRHPKFKDKLSYKRPQSNGKL